LQHLGLDLDVISIGLIARRLPPLASQPSQLGNADLIEREAVTFPLDQAFGFELACVHRWVTARCDLFSGTTDRYGICQKQVPVAGLVSTTLARPAPTGSAVKVGGGRA
jgi:hypothetical protein